MFDAFVKSLDFKNLEFERETPNAEGIKKRTHYEYESTDAGIAKMDTEQMILKAREGYFVRNAEENLVFCPQGKVLRLKSIKKNGNIVIAISLHIGTAGINAQSQTGRKLTFSSCYLASEIQYNFGFIMYPISFSKSSFCFLETILNCFFANSEYLL